MAPKTLYDIIQPILSRLNLFGFNFGNQKAAGCLRRAYKWAVKGMLLYQMWKILLRECTEWDSKNNLKSMQIFSWNLVLFTGFSLHYFCVNEREIEGMMKILKNHPLGIKSQNSLNKQLVPFKIHSTLYTVFFILATFSFGAVFIIGLHESSKDKSALYFALCQSALAESAVFTLQFPTLLGILPCIVACYCRAEMDEAIAEMKRIKSPLRRAKASAKLVEKYHQLHELASDTDRALSAAMSFIKWPFLITIATSMLVCTYYSSADEMKVGNYLIGCLVVFIPSIFAYFPLIQYLYLAPSANQMLNLINKTVIDFIFIDGEWVSRDSTLRTYLLRMSTKQVEQLNHVAMEVPPFTLFGDVVDHDVLFMIILEIIDMWNTLSGNSAEMKLNTIYRNFMQHNSVDCYYWFYF